jgi:CDGSH-type Zn-finger protein
MSDEQTHICNAPASVKKEQESHVCHAPATAEKGKESHVCTAPSAAQAGVTHVCHAPLPTKKSEASHVCKAPVKPTAKAPEQAETDAAHAKAAEDAESLIKITPGGPYMVSADVKLYEDAIVKSEDGTHMQYNRVKEYDTEGKPYFLCRCGHSHHKPFCDGTHAKIGFVGKEVADRAPYAFRADVYDGPELSLQDDGRCAFARMCHRKDGDVWTLTEEADEQALKDEAIKASWNCPTGRLVHTDKESGKVEEQEFEPSIVILEDIQEEAAGPLFVRGGVVLQSANGNYYERRNRYALCRCGGSGNQPFCDASHINIEFSDDSAAWKGDTGAEDESFDQ